MTNNKPTSLGEFLFELIKGGYINRLPAKEFQQARRVHKEEIEKAYFAGQQNWDSEQTFEQYYNETYEGGEQ
tara:strand:+ start:261 stop:476 length:216 start_codon:yes stop_codon:yes gene_type:complete